MLLACHAAMLYVTGATPYAVRVIYRDAMMLTLRCLRHAPPADSHAAAAFRCRCFSLITPVFFHDVIFATRYDDATDGYQQLFDYFAADAVF